MNAIHHLYQRAGFGLTPQEWQERRHWSVEQAVAALFEQVRQQRTDIEIPPAPRQQNMQMTPDPEAVQALRMAEREHVFQINASWVARMADPSEPALLERMTLFWHGHFACRSLVGKLAAQQLNTIRRHALGDFRELLRGIARDPSMIRYLNNQQNRKDAPNENFAREVMELFTIGRGHYSENDVKEAARAFTGWSSTFAGDYVFRRFAHDYGRKTFMGKTGNFDGDDIIDIILEQKETALFLTEKIYRYFVHPEPDMERVRQLADGFYRADYHIGKLMHTIFTSEWFYGQDVVGAKIKSPLDLLTGLMRAMEVKFTDTSGPLFVQRALGQILFNPPNVAGWAGGRSWIDNSTLMMRLNLPLLLAGSSDLNFRTKDEPEARERGEAVRRIKAQVNTRPLEALVEGQSEERALQQLALYLLPAKPSVTADQLRRYIPASAETSFAQLAALRLMSLPEYQTC